MKVTAILALATAVAGVAAAPTAQEAEINARTNGGIECCKKGGTWHWGWSGAKPSEEYICATGGLLNILNCVSVLNGNTVSVPISIIL